MLEELAQDAPGPKTCKKHFFVIADDQSDVPAGLQISNHVKHARAVRAAIDKVTQEHDRRFRRFAGEVIGIDALEQNRQKICATVDITNGIDPVALRYSGLQSASPGITLPMSQNFRELTKA
jgi:hypothetical protein